MRREVDHEEPTAGRDEARRLADRAARVVEVVEDLVDDDEVEAGRIERWAVHVALAQFPVGDADAFEVGAGHRQHRVAAVEPDRPGRRGRRAVAACGRCRCRRRARGRAADHRRRRGSPPRRCRQQRAANVLRPRSERSARSSRWPAAARRARTTSSRDTSPARTRSSASTASSTASTTPRSGLGLHQPEEGPGPFAVFGDHAGIDEQPEMSRDPRLRLSEDLGEIGDRQLAVTEERDDPQPCLLANCLECIEHPIRTHPGII